MRSNREKKPFKMNHEHEKLSQTEYSDFRKKLITWISDTFFIWSNDYLKKIGKKYYIHTNDIDQLKLFGFFNSYLQ